MFGTMLTAQDWDRLTGTDKGRRIFDSLRLFHERPLELAPPLPDLGPRLISAFRAIDHRVDAVSTISLSALKRSIDAVPDPMKPYLARDIAGAVQRALLSEFDDDVGLHMAGTGLARVDKVIDALSTGISRPHHDHLVKTHGDIMTSTSMGSDDLPFPLLGILVDQVEAICDGREREAGAIDEFFSIIRSGNVPMGQMRSRPSAGECAYAVLTA